MHPTNFNNPSNLPSTNPVYIDYGNFQSADPKLNSVLPKNVNLPLGLTSPGFIDNATECTGLDFVNTTPPVNDLTFSQCLDKFNDQYDIPELAFVNLLNNLPKTFSALPNNDRIKYINQLKEFIESCENKVNVPHKKESFRSLTGKAKENLKDTGESNNNLIFFIFIVTFFIFIILQLCFYKK